MLQCKVSSVANGRCSPAIGTLTRKRLRENVDLPPRPGMMIVGSVAVACDGVVRRQYSSSTGARPPSGSQNRSQLGWERRLHTSKNRYLGLEPYPGKGMLSAWNLKSSVGVRDKINRFENAFPEKIFLRLSRVFNRWWS